MTTKDNGESKQKPSAKEKEVKLSNEQVQRKWMSQMITFANSLLLTTPIRLKIQKRISDYIVDGMTAFFTIAFRVQYLHTKIQPLTTFHLNK